MFLVRGPDEISCVVPNVEGEEKAPMKTTKKTKINKKNGTNLYEDNLKYQGIQQKTNQ